MEKIVSNLSNQFKISDVLKQRTDLYFITVEKEQLVSVITHLKNREGFVHLVLLTAVDWIEQGQFQLTYLLKNYQLKIDVGVRVYIDRNNYQMESIHQLWITAATYQRELKEMFGIDFKDSPRLNEPFMLEGWKEIPPYRREFDTKKYSEETYFPRPGRTTIDPAEHMKKKLYPGQVR